MPRQTHPTGGLDDAGPQHPPRLIQIKSVPRLRRYQASATHDFGMMQ
jgi:hypothetical protein